MTCKQVVALRAVVKKFGDEVATNTVTGVYNRRYTQCEKDFAKLRNLQKALAQAEADHDCTGDC